MAREMRWRRTAARLAAAAFMWRGALGGDVTEAAWGMARPTFVSFGGGA